jgi:hypothetical protein
MIDFAVDRLASMEAQFTHLGFSLVLLELRSCEEVVPLLAQRFELVGPGLAAWSEILPRGVVTVLAARSVSPAVYSRHITAALLGGHFVLLSPSTRTHPAIAEWMRRAHPKNALALDDQRPPRRNDPDGSDRDLRRVVVLAANGLAVS